MQGNHTAGSALKAVVTPRLVLTPVGLDDVDDLLLLYGDPKVAHWIGPWNRMGVEAWAASMAARWAQDGVGKSGCVNPSWTHLDGLSRNHYVVPSGVIGCLIGAIASSSRALRAAPVG